MTGVPDTIPAYPLKLSWHSRGLISVNPESPTIAGPLRTLALSGQVLEWLSDSGIPTVPLDRSAVRAGISQPQRAILLFDSRDASARLDAETADSLGYATIDAAELLASRRPGGDPDQTRLMTANPRRRFLDGLRDAIEAAGGAWIRIADFPHPYRALICEEIVNNTGNVNLAQAGQTTLLADPQIDRVLSAFAEVPVAGTAAGRLAIADWLDACQSAGRPLRTATPIAHLRSRAARVRVAALTWTASLETFAQWWRYRSRLSFTAIRRGSTTELTIVPSGETDQDIPGPAAIELWRGRHCAILPVNHGTMTIQDDSIPFQLLTNRHHAGFLADEAEIGPACHLYPPMTVAS